LVTKITAKFPKKSGIKITAEFCAACAERYFWGNKFSEDAFIFEIAKYIYFQKFGKKIWRKKIRKIGPDIF